jgi:Uncharacterized protein conserved in bacteria
MQESNTLLAELEPLLSEAGLKLVDLGVSRHRGSAQVKMVVYSPRGTGTNECALAYRIAYPKVQALLAHPEPVLEVSSPGIDRALRSEREWEIFKGKGVRVLPRGETEWIRGRNEGAADGSVGIAVGGERRTFMLDDLAKARLDSTQEGD